MATKIVYVSLTAAGKNDTIEILTPAQLNALLEEGWDVLERKDHQLPDPKNPRRKATVTEYLLTTKNRGLTVSRPSEGREERRVARRVERDQRRAERAVSLSGGDNGSFIGSGSSFANLPGVGVVDSTAGPKAHMMGTDAFHAGKLIEDNPFPKGSFPHEQWARGYNAAEQSQFGAGNGDKSTGEDPYELGKRAAKGPKDLEVSCPYPSDTPPYRRWLRGFQENGGEVQ